MTTRTLRLAATLAAAALIAAACGEAAPAADSSPTAAPVAVATPAPQPSCVPTYEITGLSGKYLISAATPLAKAGESMKNADLAATAAAVTAGSKEFTVDEANRLIAAAEAYLVDSGAAALMGEGAPAAWTIGRAGETQVAVAQKSEGSSVAGGGTAASPAPDAVAKHYLYAYQPVFVFTASATACASDSLGEYAVRRSGTVTTFPADLYGTTVVVGACGTAAKPLAGPGLLATVSPTAADLAAAVAAICKDVVLP
jgi:hypothetical protein